MRYRPGSDPLLDDAVRQAIAAAESRLGDAGRLLIRKSGTEPLVRVMGEHEDEVLLRDTIEDIVAVVERAA